MGGTRRSFSTHSRNAASLGCDAPTRAINAGNRLFKHGTFDEIDAPTRAEMAAKGFCVLTEIGVKPRMRKINADIAPCRILGACSPQMAYEALRIEPRVDKMSPCNVIIRQAEGGVEVSAIDPVSAMIAVDNDALKAVASHVRDLFAELVESV